MSDRLTIRCIDSHTGGEPTRVVVGGFPDLGVSSVVEARLKFSEDFDDYRRAIVNEPRGNDIIVGALLLPPFDDANDVAVVYFNNVGVLHMCGHGTIGVVETLRYLGWPLPWGRGGSGGGSSRTVRLETSSGLVVAEYLDGRTTFVNVPAYRFRKGVEVRISRGLTVRGDVAWGGNWFFMCEDHGEVLEIGRTSELTQFCEEVRRALEKEGVRGETGEIDHIELCGPSDVADSRNFVLCPGGAYDRSPCGTGTSARVACLAADGLLAEGEVWRQESITGSIFEAWYGLDDGSLVPSIRGSAYVNAEVLLVLDSNDPLCWGIR